MPSFVHIRDRLPTLYRPEDGDEGLLTMLLKAVGTLLDEANRDASDVMQAHWLEFADRALYSPYFMRARELRKLPIPTFDDSSLVQFPYVRDLGRLAALLALPPWEEPPLLREWVEAYRRRIKRIVALYRNGLGTVDALRRMVEAQLDTNENGPPELLDRPFWIEECVPEQSVSLQVQARGEPLDLVGPLMQWEITHEGLTAALPTVYIQGVTPDPELVDPTERPLIELYSDADGKRRIGLAYSQSLGPGETLRLQPAYSSWLGLESGLREARSEHGNQTRADPTAPGPWEPAASAPVGSVTAIHQSQDGILWVATGNDAAGELWRYDGINWSRALDGLPPIAYLVEDGQDLLIGTGSGLNRMNLFPEDGAPFEAASVPGLEGQSVNGLFSGSDRLIWIGSSQGAFTMASGGPAAPAALQGTPVHCISHDRTGTLYFGSDLGLFQFQPDSNSWFCYSGVEHTEQAPDWLSLPAGSLPAEAQVALPAVHAVHRGRDASLWIGTDHGIARYTARAVRGLTYETVLEAFPDLTEGPVYTIAEDARGLVWFGSDRGLFRYDGRDWWQHVSSAWVPLGRADTLYSDPSRGRGTWRFQRGTSRWQRLDPSSSTWEDYLDDPRTNGEPAVHAVCWTDTVTADIGQWDGTTFSDSTPAPENSLHMRIKPSEQRIVEGGIPALPRIPPGTSTWRYLSAEPEAMVEPVDRPAWTMEGRLLPPPADLDPAAEGRWDVETPPPKSNFDEAVFSYRPAARVWFRWEVDTPLTILVRLKKRFPGDSIDPAILDRVWQSMQQVRPAGSHVLLAVEEDIVKESFRS